MKIDKYSILCIEPIRRRELMLMCLYGFTFNIILMILIFVLRKHSANGITSVFKYKSKIDYIDSNEGWIERISLRIAYGCPVIITVLAVIGGINELNHNYLKYAEEIVKDCNELEGFILAFWATVIAAITFIFTLGSKEYYLNFTRQDIAKRYGIHGVYIVLLISIAFSILFNSVLLQDDKSESQLMILSLFELCILSIVLLGSYALLILGRVVLSNKRFELRLLNQIYKIFWNSVPVKCNSATEDTIYVNLGYLLKKYVKLRFVTTKMNSLKKIHYGKISDIERWYRYSVKWIVMVNVFLAILSIIEIRKEKLSISWIILFGISFLTVLFFIHLADNKGFVINIMIGDSGFLLEYKDKHPVFIGEVGLIRNLKANKYIKSVKNLMALYYILCSCDNEKFEKMVSDSLAEMIFYLKENEKKQWDKLSRALYYLPVFVCAYYIYDKNPQNVSLDNVYELYKSFNLPKDDKIFHDALNSFIHWASLYRSSEKDKQNALNNKISSEYYIDYIGNNGYWQEILVHNK